MITEFSFGRIVVQGQIFTSDIKIVAGKLVPDWWRRRGHAVEIDDVQDILESQPKILVIGKGQPGYMKTTDSLRQHLETNKIKLIEEPTREAIQTFNRLSQRGRMVSGGFHVSC
jgi:hypothetical protein